MERKELQEIKKFIELMKANDLVELEIDRKGGRLSIKRAAAPLAVSVAAPVAMPVAPVVEPKKAVDSEAGLTPIKAPIVGTFYRASAPDAEPFVSVGQRVNKDSVVCIIEAMKVMNEIKADVAGVVKRILVENATPVQFGQVLILVDPA